MQELCFWCNNCISYFVGW